MPRTSWLLGPLLLAAVACGGGGTPPPDAVVVLLPREPDTLDPRMCGDPACVKVTRLIYRSLVTVDPRTLDLVPDLASSVAEVDPLRYDVVLRPGVRFHSGATLGARDVAATLSSIADPRLGSPYQRSYARYQALVTGPLTLTIRLAAPHATVLGDLELPILPARLARSRPITGATADGTGPFRLADRRPGRIELRPFAGAHARVVMRLLKDDNTRALRLLGGGGDVVVNGMPPELLPIFDWASLIRRVYLDDVLACPCGGRGRVLAEFTEPASLCVLRVRNLEAEASFDPRAQRNSGGGGSSRVARRPAQPPRRVTWWGSATGRRA